MENKEFIKATPEETGIGSEHIVKFLKELEYHKITMHSVILIKNDKCIFEQYYAPYKRDTLHRMFSVAKSFTSLGIGLLEDEQKLKLEDRIIKYFPDMLPDNKEIPEYLAEMTIKDMLRMMTCYKATTYDKFNNKQDWVRTFFNTPPDHRPGTIFSYDTSSTHTLATLIERLSGKKFLDYLREKFLDEIGFSKEAYMVSDPVGAPMGGSGLMATPMDLAKVAFVVMNDGCWNGKQLLPLKYIKEATKKQVDTLIKAPTTEEAQGYGYQIWRIQNNGFAFYGMGGQLAICLPDYDLICVTTADTQGKGGSNQFIYDSLYSEILPYINDCDILNEEAKTELENMRKNACIKPLKNSFEQNMTIKDRQLLSMNIERINGKKYKIEANDKGFTEIMFKFTDRSGSFCYKIEQTEFELSFEFGNHQKLRFPYYNDYCLTSAVWLSSNTLYIKSHIIGERVGSVDIQAVFDEDRVTVFMKKTEETFFNEFNGYLNGKL